LGDLDNVGKTTMMAHLGDDDDDDVVVKLLFSHFLAAVLVFKIFRLYKLR
jgi:hypothetical protein